MSPSEIFRVVKGTGMGMIPSGSISGAVLFANLERDLILEPKVKEKFCILYYARFRDDI